MICPGNEPCSYDPQTGGPSRRKFYEDLKELFPLIAWASSPYGFAAAWHATGLFWRHTLAAAAHHALLILVVAAIPAAIRIFLLFDERPQRRWELNLAEALLTLWRVLICGIAVWAVMSPGERYSLILTVASLARVQVAIQRVGADLGRSLHLFFWEMVLFALSFWLVHIVLALAADGLASLGGAERRMFRFKMVSLVLRNVVLIPLGLIYLASIAYYAVL